MQRYDLERLLRADGEVIVHKLGEWAEKRGVTLPNRPRSSTTPSTARSRQRTMPWNGWPLLPCHVPERGKQTIRYYGAYANSTRGRLRKRQQVEPIPTVLEPVISSEAFRRNWARLIQCASWAQSKTPMRSGGSWNIWVSACLCVPARRQGWPTADRNPKPIPLPLPLASMIPSRRFLPSKMTSASFPLFPSTAIIPSGPQYVVCFDS